MNNPLEPQSENTPIERSLIGFELQGGERGAYKFVLHTFRAAHRAAVNSEFFSPYAQRVILGNMELISGWAREEFDSGCHRRWYKAVCDTYDTLSGTVFMQATSWFLGAAK